MKKLEEDGFRIQARNWHCRYGELDIVAENQEFLLLVEVKTRKNRRFAEPFQHVDMHKQRKLRTTAELYLAEYPQDHLQPRFDVASVVATEGEQTKKPEIEYIENAF